MTRVEDEHGGWAERTGPSSYRVHTTHDHVCGLQGFGALGDVCPACEQSRNLSANLKLAEMTPDTPKPPAPAPASAETLEQINKMIGAWEQKDLVADGEPPVIVEEDVPALRAAADALRRLQSTEQERDRSDRIARGCGDHADAMTAKMLEWKARAEAAEQRLRDLEQEQG